VERIGRIYENRVAQLDQQGYLTEMRRLRQGNRAIEQQHAISEGRQPAKPRGGPMTPKEQEAFDAQGHYAFKDLAPAEQAKLNKELSSMWGQIPAHLQEKARKLIT
jgi:hypothetical protein